MGQKNLMRWNFVSQISRLNIIKTFQFLAVPPNNALLIMRGRDKNLTISCRDIVKMKFHSPFITHTPKYSIKTNIKTATSCGYLTSTNYAGKKYSHVSILILGFMGCKNIDFRKCNRYVLIFLNKRLNVKCTVALQIVTVLPTWQNKSALYVKAEDLKIVCTSLAQMIDFCP